MSNASVRAVSNKSTQIPKTGIAGLRENWKSDIISGLIVFMIALPLSVGIALASGAPATAGIFAAIVGGILGSLFTGSYVTINGPAAGLIVIVYGSIQTLGHGDPMVGFKATLAATIAAGTLQIGMGLCRLASVGLSFPSAVIHGMLSAIGVIIMSKQIHVALGVKPSAPSILGLIGEIPHSVIHANPVIALIGGASAFILIFFAWMKNSPLKKIPAPLVVVLVGIGMGKFFDLEHEHTVGFFSARFPVGHNCLLNIPDHLTNALVFPDFSQFMTGPFFGMVITIALVASLESVLSTFAVDKLDPYRRSSDLNKDLISKGICNVVLGWIGGLPLISEIVRSSANVSSGAKTRWSNFFHGSLMLLVVVIFPHILHKIPTASLAVILVFTGFNLARPSQLVHAKEIGSDHLVVFVVTLLTTLMTDLLVGVGVGIVVELVFNFLKRMRIFEIFKLKLEITKTQKEVRIQVVSAAVFTNYLYLKKALDANMATQGSILLDLTQCPVVDHTVLENLHHYKKEFEEKGVKFEIRFSKDHAQMTPHPLSARMLKQKAS